MPVDPSFDPLCPCPYCTEHVEVLNYDTGRVREAYSGYFFSQEFKNKSKQDPDVAYKYWLVNFPGGTQAYFYDNPECFYQDGKRDTRGFYSYGSNCPEPQEGEDPFADEPPQMTPNNEIDAITERTTLMALSEYWLGSFVHYSWIDSAQAFLSFCLLDYGGHKTNAECYHEHE